MFKRIKRWFLSGLLLVIPAGGTLLVLFMALDSIDGLLTPIQKAVFKAIFGEELVIPGLGIVVICLLVLFVGFLTSNLATRRIAGLPDRILGKLPLVKLLYHSLRDLFEAFVGEKRGFTKPVLIRLFPGSPAELIGFVTNEDLSALGLRERVAVYLPQSYNFGGLTMLVPADAVKPLECDSGQVMAFVMSGGISLTPPDQLAAPSAPGDAARSRQARGHGRPLGT